MEPKFAQENSEGQGLKLIEKQVVSKKRVVVHGETHRIIDTKLKSNMTH